MKEMSGADSERDFYAILGADEGASQEEIERRYKRLAVRHHPDRGGDEEEMKSINEAYRTLGNESARNAYDAGRRRTSPSVAFVPVTRSAAAQADAIGGRVVGALMFLFGGVALLLLVRFHFIWFLFPLALLAASLVFAGIMLAHAALVLARENVGARRPARRFVWAQETAFWSIVAASIYAIYLVMSLA